MSTSKRPNLPVDWKETRPSKRRRSNGSTPAALEQFQLAAKLVDFDAHKDVISATLEKLKEHCADGRNWAEGHEAQEELMSDIVSEITLWFPSLWSAMMEHGADIDMIVNSISYCSETVEAMKKCHTRAEFMQLDSFTDITDREAKTIYHHEFHVDAALIWFWREIIVLCAVQCKSEALALEKVARFGMEHELLCTIRRSSDEKEDCNGASFWDEHWTEPMHQSAKVFVAGRVDEKILEFGKKPSLVSYKNIVSLSPTSKPLLVDSTRKSLAMKCISHSDAADIFIEACSTDDILSLIDALKVKSDRSDPTTRFIREHIGKYLSTRHAPEHRQIGLDILKEDTALPAKKKRGKRAQPAGRR